TTPFAYEGKKRIAQAEEGIRKLKDYVDTLLVISNDKMRHQFGNLTMKAAFSKADNVLATAAKCITDVISSTGQINVDFADVCTVMRSGGVAILGSAACEGENRAQQAIEDALNSPLLNDNDISGAKWILININSAEGDNEFTMDEVETIQNHLLSQAGENTDVILGLGYDNSLENKIGITLIATGFDHKDPFDKKETPKEQNKAEEKVVMTLILPEEKKNIYQQPVFQFDEKKSIVEELEAKNNCNPIAAQQQEINVEPKVAETIPDAMAPTIKEEETILPLVEVTADKSQPEIIHFELSLTPDTAVHDEIPTPVISELPKHINTERVSAPSGGYLAKPSNIYIDEQLQHAQEFPKRSEEPQPLQKLPQVEEPAIEMQLVEKKTLEIVNEQQETKPVQPIELANEDEPTMDETEGLKRKAMERISKLRNLSFNINATDPNNEFEAVPAYLRRNMELHNSIADVESFYSNYTVKTDQNNEVVLSTINTFLEGKKPD
ncbi:MAG: cell division protein FtsZ, partial [Chitinophagaceae bacterium]|nr:cell division protein FtsZ [Chitinophagaceae bacterium]